jgi:hypothetical protein
MESFLVRPTIGDGIRIYSEQCSDKMAVIGLIVL